MNRELRRISKQHGARLMKKGFDEWDELSGTLRFQEIVRKAHWPPKKFYQNSMYSVQLHERESKWGYLTLLMVRRNDEGPIRSWSDMQRIKNEIVGSHRTAIEVYPAEHNLVDQANMYHIWVLPEGFDLPFGLYFKGLIE